MFKKIVFVLVIVLGLGLVAGKVYANRNSNSVPPVASSDEVITLERTACFGTCPIYTITIYGDGQVVYFGDDYVKAEGEHRAEISPEKVQELIDFMVNGGYLELETEYTNRVITDMPSTITSLTMNGETKGIEHYFGDDNAPLILHQIENRIDVLVNSAQWTGQDSEENNKGVVYGHLTVRGSDSNIQLPEGAVITVRLEDVSLQDMPSTVIAERSYTELVQFPEFYDIAYEIDALDSKAIYAVSVDVLSADGELLYWTDTAYNVLTYGAGGYVDIEIVTVQ